MKFWNWLSGKKRTIALIYWSVVVPSLMVIWPNGYSEGFPLIFSKVVTVIGLLLSSLGLGHAAVKTMYSKKNTEEVEEVKEEVIEPVKEETNADKKDS